MTFTHTCVILPRESCYTRPPPNKSVLIAASFARVADDITRNKTNIISVSRRSLFEEMKQRGSHTAERNMQGQRSSSAMTHTFRLCKAEINKRTTNITSLRCPGAWSHHDFMQSGSCIDQRRCSDAACHIWAFQFVASAHDAVTLGKQTHTSLLL